MANDDNGAGRIITSKERTFERGRGCWNCKSYENGQMAKQQYALHRAAKVAELRMREAQGVQAGTTPIGDHDLSSLAIQKKLDDLKKTGLTEAQAVEVIAAAAAAMKGGADDPAFRLFDQLFATNAAGICLVGGLPSDFVHNQCLCEKWNGRDGSSVATSGRPLDKLADELGDIAEGRAKKV